MQSAILRIDLRNHPAVISTMNAGRPPSNRTFYALNLTIFLTARLTCIFVSSSCHVCLLSTPQVLALTFPMLFPLATVFPSLLLAVFTVLSAMFPLLFAMLFKIFVFIESSVEVVSEAVLLSSVSWIVPKAS